MQADAAHDLAHLDRVWANVQAIADGADLRVLVAATYLHDLVNLPKDHPDRAQASTHSAKAAGPILTNLGYSETEITATQHAIAAHSFSAGIAPKTPEARVLRDADRLDALGAIGIARTFAVAGALDRPLYDPEDPFAQSRDLDDGIWSLDHWQAKLLKLPGDMLTKTGRVLAQKRVAVMVTYLHALGEEIGTPAPESWS